jgi:hypothetical protein
LIEVLGQFPPDSPIGAAARRLEWKLVVVVVVVVGVGVGVGSWGGGTAAAAASRAAAAATGEVAECVR